MFVPASAQRLARIQSGSFKPACCRFLRSVIQLALAEQGGGAHYASVRFARVRAWGRPRLVPGICSRVEQSLNCFLKGCRLRPLRPAGFHLLEQRAAEAIKTLLRVLIALKINI